MDDLISLNAAINALKNVLVSEELEYAISVLEELPSTQQAGKWINDKGLYRCSVCNELWCDWWASVIPIERMNKLMHYCPHCGARMVEREEE